MSGVSLDSRHSGCYKAYENAYAERWVRGVREECLSKVIPIGQGMLQRVLREYGAHFHHERNHEGVGNVLIMPRASCEHREGPVIRRPRLGGLLNYYERAAAWQSVQSLDITRSCVRVT
jgi:putative transposase